MQKFETIRQPLSVVLNNGGNKWKNMQNSGHLRLCQQPGQRTHSARTKNCETTLGVALSLAILTSIMLHKSSPHTLLRPFIKKTNLNDCNLYFNVAVTRNKHEFKMSSFFYNHDIARTFYSCKSVTSWINSPSSTLNARNNYTKLQINRQQIIWWWRSTWRRHFLWWDQE